MTKTILVIDDDPEAVAYLQDIFVQNGYAVLTAGDGVEGLETAQARQPDLITLDMDMPARGGALFYVKLRQEPRLAEIPVVVISGMVPRPPSVGKNVPFLAKPVEPARLLRLVAEMLGEGAA